MRNRFSDEISDQLIGSCRAGQVNLRLLAYLGHMAPSVHNTQPWSLRLDHRARIIEITPCTTRFLVHSDPTHRQAWISIGALLQNILIAAASLPLHVIISQARPDILRLIFQPKAGQAGNEDKLRTVVATILSRHSNRHNFQAQHLPTAIMTELNKGLRPGSGAKIILVTDQQQIKQLAQLTRQASLLAFSSSQLRRELAVHLNPPFSRRLSGIPSRSVSSSLGKAWFEKPLTKSTRFIVQNADIEYRRLLHSSLLALVLTAGDTQSDWLHAGRKYEQLCLKITELGLSHSTTAALVEAPEYYKDVAALIDTKLRLQAVVRVGHGQPAKSRAKRLPLDSVLQATDYE